jgi:hypothetical protein
MVSPHTSRWPVALSSLRVQLPILIAALLTLVVAVYCVAAYREMRSAAIERARSRLQRAAHQLAEMSEAGTRRRAATLRIVARGPALAR